MIEFIYFKSTNLYSAQYNPKDKTLKVEFMRGDVYLYHNISKDLWKELKEAESPGKFFNIFLKKQYGEEKIN